MTSVGVRVLQFLPESLADDVLPVDEEKIVEQGPASAKADRGSVGPSVEDGAGIASRHPERSGLQFRSDAYGHRDS